MDLSTLQSYLTQKAAGGTLTLSTTDTNLGTELQTLLSTAPLTTIVINTAAGQGITLNNDVLTIDGTSSEAWPITGLTGQTVSMSHVTIVLQGSATTTVDLKGTGTLTVDTAAMQVVLGAGSTTPGEWKLSNAAQFDNVSPLTLMAFPGFGALPIQIPDNVTFFSQGFSLPIGTFNITYYPQTTNPTVYTFLEDAPTVQWTIVPSVFEFTGLSFGATWLGMSLSLTIATNFQIGSTPVVIGLTANATEHWTAFIRPKTGNAFPGIADIAHQLGGTSSQSTVTDGFTNMGFDQGAFDAAINGITFGFDWKNTSLDFLKIDSTLTIKNIAYHVSVEFPDLVIRGWLDPDTPIKIADFFSSFGLNVEAIPDDLEISQIGLLADIANSNYGLSVELDDDSGWDIGPLTLNSLGFNVQYASGSFSGSISADITVAKVDISLEAGYDTTRGWYFQGGTAQDSQVMIGDFISDIGGKFNITVPTSIANMTLQNINFSYETLTGNFGFQLEMDLQIQEVPVSIIPFVQITNTGTPQSPKWDDTYAGTITIGTLEFLLLFNKTDEADLFLAVYSHTGAQQPIQLHSLVNSISPALANIIPTSLAIDLKDVIFAYYSVTTPTPAKKWTIGMDLGVTFNLSNIPLIGTVLPAHETVGFQNLKVQYSNNAFTKDDATKINEVLQANAPDALPLPAAGFPSGVNATAVMQFGTTTSSLNLDVTGNATQGPQTPPAGNAPTTQQFSNGFWYSLQRTIGPIYFDRVGVNYTNGALFFMLDGSFTLAGLNISLQGAGFGSPLDHFELEFTLSGIGISYTAPGIEIGGGLLRVDPLPEGVSFQFDGDVVMQIGKFSLAAIGSYAQLETGEPSLFVFANVPLPLGPIPAFFITGISAGFGYNRNVLIPTVNQVLDFPLIAVANQEPGMPTDMGKVLSILEGKTAGPSGTKQAWIQPELGEYWLAFGLQFNSYQLVFSNAMVVAKLGKELELALIGLSKMQLPQSGDTRYVYVELMLVVDWKPDAGFFSITAQLSNNSFVLDKNCKLTGGFAFNLWYSGTNAGQFVVTLGGYHPQFKPPPFYPTVPRLGVNWQISSMLSLTGGAYFALTPSAAMAGGSLALNFHDGNLKAWFTAEANFLVTFNPFYFTADISLSVGVSYKLDLLFTTTTIKVELGAGLSLYGPDLGGSVYVDFYIIGFTIKFGADPKGQRSTPLEWTEFQPLLPAGNENTLAISSGATSQMADGTYVVRADQFAFSTNSVIPAKKLTYNGANAVNTTDYAFDIRPMNLTGVDATHDVQIFLEGVNDPIDLSTWALTPVNRDMPAALWGTPLTSNGQFVLNPTIPSSDTIPQAPVGIFAQAPEPTLGDSLAPVPVTELEYEPIEPDGTLPIKVGDTPQTTYEASTATDTVGQIQVIDTGTALSNRTALATALQAGSLFPGWNGLLTQFAATAANQFTDVPLKI